MLAEGDDSVTTYIDNCIYKGESLTKVLKLLIIHSLTQGGYKAKQYDAMKREIMHAYGYEALFTLEHLERLGLLHHQDVKNHYPTVRDSLNLLNLNLNLMDDHPRDFSYIFGGYAPLSCRIAEAAARPGGWQSIQETLKLLPGGPAFEITQETSHVGVKPPVTLVFYVGGVCYSEISALRALSNFDTTTRSDFIIGATSIVNADKLVKSFVETLPTPQIPSEFLEFEKDPTNPF